MNPKEQAQHLMVKYLRIKGPGNSYGLSKKFVHLLVDQILEELRLNNQTSYIGVERIEYWKLVKAEIDTL